MLTKRQKEILDFIKISTNINGYAPSLKEIGDHFKLSAVSTIHEHIQNLQKKGYLKGESQKARSLEVAETVNTSSVQLKYRIDQNCTLVSINPTGIPLPVKRFSTSAYFAQVESDLPNLNLFKDDLLLIDTFDDFSNPDQILVATLADGNKQLGKIDNSAHQFISSAKYSNYLITAKVIGLWRNF